MHNVPADAFRRHMRATAAALRDAQTRTAQSLTHTPCDGDGGFELVAEEMDCCRRTAVHKIADTGPGVEPSALGCRQRCNRLANCTHFSHSLQWRDCIFCAGCVLDSRQSSSAYTSWRRCGHSNKSVVPWRPAETYDLARYLDDANVSALDHPFVIRATRSRVWALERRGVLNISRERASLRSCRNVHKVHRPACHCLPQHRCEWPTGIPKHIHLTARTKSQVPTFIPDRWLRLNPSFTVTLHDDDACETFIVQEWHKHSRGEGHDWLGIWHRAKEATKSDLFRLLYLYVHGGVYVDWDIEPVASLQSWVQPTDHFVTSGSRMNTTVNGHFIITRPLDPVLYRTMQHMLARIARHPYGNAYNVTYWRWSICFALHDGLRDHIGHTTFEHNEAKTYAMPSGNYRILAQQLVVGTVDKTPRKAMLSSDAVGRRAPGMSLLMFDKWNRNASYPPGDPRRWMDAPLWRKVNWAPR